MTLGLRQFIKDRLFRFFQPRIWEGIYSRPSDVPARGPGFKGIQWQNECEATLARLRTKPNSDAFLPLPVDSDQILLPFLLSVLSPQQKEVRVLDFGGGFGISYQHVLMGVANPSRVDYHIVDTDEVCRHAAPLWAADPRLHYHPDLPAGLGAVDVLYIASTLQYIEEYASLLEKLCSTYHPRYFLLGKLSAGDIPTYVTAQKNHQGSIIPYRFLNIGEVVQRMQAYGYTLVYKSTLGRNYPQWNFPKTHRMGRACNLLFVYNNA